MNNLTSLTLLETIDGLDKKEFSGEELKACYLGRIEKVSPQLNAFLLVNKEVKGIPSAIKDIICTQNITTTAGSKILSNFVPQYNATVIERILKQGIGVIGKTNLDEFAMGSSG